MGRKKVKFSDSSTSEGRIQRERRLEKCKNDGISNEREEPYSRK